MIKCYVEFGIFTADSPGCGGKILNRDFVL